VIFILPGKIIYFCANKKERGEKFFLLFAIVMK